MKTKLILTLSAILALGLVACGDDDDDKDNKSECTKNADCADRTDGKTECDTTNKVCVVPASTPECATNSDCADRTDGKTACNTETNKCVTPTSTPECTTNSDCADRTDGKTECNTETNKCVTPTSAPECTSDEDCADRTDDKTECDTVNQVCVEPEETGVGAIKISQVYLGGFTPNVSSYNASYLELFNKGTGEANLATYSIIYGKSHVSDAVSLSSYCSDNKCSIPVGGYLLLKVKALTSGTNETTLDLEPDIDLNGNPNIGVDGMIAIVNNSQIAVNESDCNTILNAADDLIGMGTNTWCHEGSANATGIDNNNRHDYAYTRKGQGCTDSDNNGDDFEVLGTNPRNSSTALISCDAE